ncbi:MAG: ABA4-like family protein [Phyllobacteriaceae bacterium]|nr:ABA4-like family protein [Phyllobacteriaceae bacterium]
MPLETLFSTASSLAMVGWLVLLISPFVPRVAHIVSGRIIPLILSVGYTALILAFWSSGEGGFDTLDNVARLFESRELLLAGWVHFLAFDLFVGAWIVRDARETGALPFWLVLPCLPLTLLFGPAGLAAYFALRAARRPAHALA